MKFPFFLCIVWWVAMASSAKTDIKPSIRLFGNQDEKEVKNIIKSGINHVSSSRPSVQSLSYQQNIEIGNYIREVEGCENREAKFYAELCTLPVNFTFSTKEADNVKLIDTENEMIGRFDGCFNQGNSSLFATFVTRLGSDTLCNVNLQVKELKLLIADNCILHKETVELLKLLIDKCKLTSK